MSGRSRLPFISLYSIFTAIRGVSGLILPLYFVSVGIPDLQVGISIGFFGASLLIFESCGASSSTGWARGLAIFASTALSTATYLLLPFVRNVEGAILAEFLLGASGPILAVVARSLVISRSESSGWAGGFGLLGAIYAMAQVVGALIASLTSPAIGFGDTFYLAAATTVSVYLVYLRWSRSTGSWAGLGDLATGLAKDEPRPSPGLARPPPLALVAVPTFIGYSFFVNIMQLVVTQTPSISRPSSRRGW